MSEPAVQLTEAQIAAFKERLAGIVREHREKLEALLAAIRARRLAELQKDLTAKTDA